MYLQIGLIILVIEHTGGIYSYSGTCTGQRPIKPICGSDRRIYYNECDLKDRFRVNSYPVYSVPWKECAFTKCNQICTKEFNPVCGSDGEIAGNPCAFLYYHVCEQKQYVYETDMEFCLKKKCPYSCINGNERCLQEQKRCKSSWAGMVSK